MPTNQNCGFDPLCDVPMSPAHGRDSLHISRGGTPLAVMQTGSGHMAHPFTRRPAIFVECAAYHDFPRGKRPEKACQATGYLHDGELTEAQVRRIFDEAGWRIYSGPGTTTRCDAHADVPTYDVWVAQRAPIEPAVF